MSELQDLSASERSLLLAALEEPLFDRDPVAMGLCLRLCGRRLLQRAGGVSIANGWRGSAHAFVLTREGWNLIMAERRRRGPIRRAG
jgi:hypothetical protein